MLTDVLQVFRTFLPFLVIPPLGLVWLALFGLAVSRRRPQVGRPLLFIGVLGLYAVGTPLFSHALLSGLEIRQSIDSRPNPGGDAPGAIIVLGGDGQGVYDVPDQAQVGPLSLERLAGAAVLQRQTGLPVLMTGGNVGSDQPPVAALMARAFTDDFGLPVQWREERAGNTCENARLSAAILRQAGIPSAWVVTHSWHMQRSLLSFRRVGYNASAAPLPAERFAFSGIGDLMPRMSGWNRSYYAFHEWIGLVAYSLGACKAVPGNPGAPTGAAAR